jgi:exosortase/archaeosortase family protein
MGYSPDKKARKKKQTESTLVSEMRSNWRQKLPVLIFVIGFAVLMILFYVFWLSDYCQNNIQIHIVNGNARLSSFLLNILGQGTVADGSEIKSKAFSISIAKGCDAIEAMALFAVALLVFPAQWKHKLAGLFAGLTVLFFLNLVRIISLYLVGIYYPKAFEIMHVEVWQVLFIIFAIGLWIFWIKWTRKGVAHAQE